MILKPLKNLKRIPSAKDFYPQGSEFFLDLLPSGYPGDFFVGWDIPTKSHLWCLARVFQIEIVKVFTWRQEDQMIGVTKVASMSFTLSNYAIVEITDF